MSEWELLSALAVVAFVTCQTPLLKLPELDCICQNCRYHCACSVIYKCVEMVTALLSHSTLCKPQWFSFVLLQQIGAIVN